MNNPFSRWLKWYRDGAASPAMDRPGPLDVRPEDYVGTDQEANEKVVRAGFVPKAKKFLGRLPMASDIVAMYFCILDSKIPPQIRGRAVAALAYFIVPLDLIPDLLPMVGLTDDIAVLTAALTALAAHVTAEHRHRAREWMKVENLNGPDPAQPAS
jgi:uncharacterized membrane protein YkvA (DUF1232 family)